MTIFSVMFRHGPSFCRSQLLLLLRRRRRPHHLATSPCSVRSIITNPASFPFTSIRLNPSAVVRGWASFSSASHIPDDIGRPNSVRRDLSPLADETRAAITSTMKTMYGLSNALAFLGLCLGTWVCHYHHATTTPASSVLITVMMGGWTCMSVGFPLWLSCSLRRLLRAMFFYKRMEEEGRLNILSLNLQVAKDIDRFFARLRSISCVWVGGGVFLLLPLLLQYCLVQRKEKKQQEDMH